MTKECKRTRQTLLNYLHGHVFLMHRARIERHLQQCVVCRSEFEALRRAEETKQILKDINAPQGVVGRMKEGVFSLIRLKKVLYRPLWIMGIVLIVGAVYYYEVTPRQLDLEIERIVKTAPSTSPASSSPAMASHQVSASSAAVPTPALEPLLITITPNNNTSAIRRINEVMGRQGKLWTVKFSDTIKEVSGSLTAKELTVFFNRIAPSAKISYERKQFKSFPATEPIPFVMKLKASPQLVEKQMPSPGRTEQAAPDMPAAAPASHPAEQATPPSATTVPPSPPGQ